MAICLSVNTANRKFSSNLVVLHGSPHRDSHTEKLTYDHLAQYTDGTAIFHFDLFHTPIYPCIDCKYCQTHDGCPIDDPFESIVGKLDEADTIILSTPVYYMGFPAPVKAKIFIFILLSFISYINLLYIKSHILSLINDYPNTLTYIDIYVNVISKNIDVR